MKKLRVLWFCGAEFSESKPNATGTWLYGMLKALMDTGTVELYNITTGKVPSITQRNYGEVNQWVVPNEPLGKNGLPSNKTVQSIVDVVKEVNPEVIHVWGTETYWGLLPARGYITGPAVVEIQGLIYVWEKYFFYGMTWKNMLGCLAIKDFVHPSLSLFGVQRSFRKWGAMEKEIIVNSKHISTQSSWTRAYIKTVNPTAKIFSTKRSLRSEFIDASQWSAEACNRCQIFTSTSSTMSSYKGLHVLIDAVALLKKRYPKVRLNIAGSIMKGIRYEDGYTRWLKKKIKSKGLEENIAWLGSLTAAQIVDQMHQANAVAVPSFIESYCLALDESLTVGVPTVVSFSGAMPELAKHEQTALYFPPGDAVMCASYLERIFENASFAEELSANARFSKKDKSAQDIAKTQLGFYYDMLNIPFDPEL